MKLLIISTMSGFPWGGSEELWYQTALYAIEHGNDVHIIAFENLPQHTKWKTLIQKGAKVNFIGKEEVIYAPLWKRALSKIKGRLLPIVYRNRFSFIHSLDADFVLLSQGGSLDITYIQDLKDFFYSLSVPFAVLNQHHREYGFLPVWQQKVISGLYQKALKVFFVSHRNKEVMERQLAQSISAEIVKNPVNIKDESRIEWPQTEIPKFAVVARLDVDFKGQDILIQTLSSPKWMERNFVVNLFGSGPHNEYLEKLIKFYKLDHKIFLKGHIDNIKEIWREHNLLILPSYSEGTPLSLVEAMLCGRPAIVTDVGDCALLIDNEKNGWVAHNSSYYSLDQTLDRVWCQQNRWEEKGRSAHSAVLHFIEVNPGKALFERIAYG